MILVFGDFPFVFLSLPDPVSDTKPGQTSDQKRYPGFDFWKLPKFHPKMEAPQNLTAKQLTANSLLTGLGPKFNCENPTLSAPQAKILRDKVLI